MKEIAVKSLFGESWRVGIRPDETVADLKYKLKKLDARLAKVALSFQFQSLEEDQLVKDIGLETGDFVTAILKKSRSSKASQKGRRAASSSKEPLLQAHVQSREGPRPFSAAGPQEPKPTRGSEGPPDTASCADGDGRPLSAAAAAAGPAVLDTLLEGYGCRPGASPLMRKRPLPRPTPSGQQQAPARQPQGRRVLFDEAAPDGIGGGSNGGPCSATSREPGGTGKGTTTTAGEDLFQELHEELVVAAAAVPAAPPPCCHNHQQEGPLMKAPAGVSAAPTQAVPAQAAPAAAAAAAEEGGGGRAAGNLAASSGLPLPEPLERLDGIFTALNAVYGFMLSQHIQATWQNSRAAVQDLLTRASPQGSDRLEVADLEAAAQLAPDVVVLRDWCLLQPSGAKGGASASHQESTMGSNAGAPEGQGGEEPQEGWLQSFVIELMEPGRQQVQREATSYHQAVGSGTPDLGLDAAGLGSRGLVGMPGSSRATHQEEGGGGGGSSGVQRFRSNSSRRRAAAFRRRLVLSVALALSRRGHGDTVLEAIQRSSALPQPPSKDKRRRRRKQEGAQDESEGQEGQERQEWPPGCEWRSVTLQEAVDAVHGSAGKQEAAVLAAWGRQHAGDPSAPRPPVKRGSCSSTEHLGALEFLEHLKTISFYEGQVEHVEDIPKKLPSYAETASPLSQQTQKALEARGAQRLFSHQAAAIDAAMSGKNVAVCASTASGKSLCYNIPIMEAVAADSAACAIYMFPTKALAQDQLRATRQLLQDGFGAASPRVDVYDGDTPLGVRGEVRQSAQLLITNPDMLHCSILPVHPQFSRLLGCLRYVVIDEGHYYTGVFGAHTALVIRRLRRICESCYGRSPQFIVTSATMANPLSHTQELLGIPDIQVIDNDGSPHGSKSFVLWNPPLRTTPPGEVSWRRKKQQQAARDSRRRANQVRGAGIQLGRQQPGEGTAEWLAACKVGKKRLLQPEQRVDNAGASGAVAALGSPQLDQPLPSHTASTEAQPDLDAKATFSGSLPPGPQADAAASSTSDAKRRHLLRLEAQELVDAVARPPGGEPKSGWHNGGRRPGSSSSSSSSSRAVSGGAKGPSFSAAAAARGPRPLIVKGPGRISKDKKAEIQERVERESRLREAAEAEGRSSRGGSSGGNGTESAAVAGEQEVVYGAAGTRASERRGSPMVELATLLAECVQHGIQTLAFCNTRKLCELVTAYTRDILRLTHPELADLVAVYRSGYSAEERRSIERRLHSGQLRAVCATNAMELGLDVGDLDATLHLGFAGSVASLWQQAGRAGRRGKHSLAVYVAFDGPLDQYFMRHPQALFGRPIEQTTVDAQNYQLLKPHLVCAAQERQLQLSEDDVYFGSGLRDCSALAVEDGSLGPHPQAPMARDVLLYMGKNENFASTISLRAIDPNRIKIVNEAANDEVMEEVEECKAFWQIYAGAIYYHQGKTFLCKSLDLAKRIAVVRPADVKYYTTTADFVDIHVVGSAFAYPMATNSEDCPFTTAAVGQALVTTRFMAFYRIFQYSGKVFDTVPLHLPDIVYETRAVYIRVPPSAREACKKARVPFRDSIHAASHAVLNIIPMYLTCGHVDLGTECDNPYDSRYRPERILIYDKHPGGIGLAQQLHPLMGVVLQRALELVDQCDCTGCDRGCPACVQHTKCDEYNAVLHKEGAKIVLSHVMKHEVLWPSTCSTEEESKVAAVKIEDA